MQRSYLDYAMSVIVARALPDVRDGLKPVHRRILYAMREGGYDHGKPPRKSARIVGDVMGKYHPHGDSAIYDSLVRMAQDFSMRVPLIDGQGNFGSMDGDPPAAMRYTEARSRWPPMRYLTDIDKDTVDFRPTYDESDEEPVVLPAQYPNLLVNGQAGIAVGMATNVPPHNLGEVIDVCVAMIDDPDLGFEEMLALMPGPDFPTGAMILGQSGIRQAYATGRGSVVIRSRTHVEEIRKDRFAIVITEVPFQVNKARMQERMGELVREKRVEGISEIRDESDRDGTRVVIELKRDADSDIVLNQLFRHTPLQISFGVNLVALRAGRPEQLNVRDVFEAFLEFREEVILRRTAFDLTKARERAHILVGLAVAVANIDEVIALIRSAPDPATAKAELCARDWPKGDIAPLLALAEEGGDGSRYGRRGGGLSSVRTAGPGDPRAAPAPPDPARALQAHRRAEGAGQEDRGSSPDPALARAALEVLKEELLQVKEKFATPRRTTIEDLDFDIDIEDLIQKEDMVVTVTKLGYIKRTPLSTYREQRRGGKGRKGMATHDDDHLEQLFVTTTHTPVLFFSSEGRVYKLKVYKLPLGNPQARGKAMVNLFPQLTEGEYITAVLPLPEDESTYDELSVVFATSSGKVRRNALADFIFVPANGKIAMKLDGEDHLVGVAVGTENSDVLLAAKGGKCVRFPLSGVRVFRSRSSEGVRGMALAGDDRVISMSILDHIDVDIDERDAFLRYDGGLRRQNGDGPPEKPDEIADERLDELSSRQQMILSVTINGYGKRSSAYEYRVTNRGGQGIINIETSARNGEVIAAFPVTEHDQIMLVTDQGKVIRIPVDGIRIAGRNTQGVTLFNTDADEHVVSVARLEGAADIEDEAAEDDAESDENGSGERSPDSS